MVHYLSQKNLGELLRLAETLASQKKPRDSTLPIPAYVGVSVLSLRTYEQAAEMVSYLYSSLQPCETRRMSLHGAIGYASSLSAPRCPIPVLAPDTLGGIPRANVKVFVLPTYLPNTGEGCPKAMRHENGFLLDCQNLDYNCHCPAETLLKPQETGGTVTHSVQVVDSLLWHQPSKGEQTRLCSCPHPGLPLLDSHATWCCS